jgi:uroporphyrin-III C-methyltransferase
MGMTSSQELQTALLKSMPPDTPIAVVQNASLPSQRHVCTDLAQLNAVFTEEKLTSPAIIIIGNVLLGLRNLSANYPPEQALAG